MATKAKVVPTKDMVLAKTDLQLLKDVISIADLATTFGTEATVNADVNPSQRAFREAAATFTASGTGAMEFACCSGAGSAVTTLWSTA